MGKKKTHEEYVRELAIKNPNIQVIGKYAGANTPIEHYCINHNVFWSISPHNILNGKGCKECKREKVTYGQRKSHDKYIEELKVKNPLVEVVEQYVNSNTPIMHHCLVHDIYWKTTPGRALQGVGCEECKKIRFRKTRRKTHEQYVEELLAVNPNIKVIEKYIDATTPIKHYCEKHNVFWCPTPDSILSGHGCVECGKEKIGDKARKKHEEYINDVGRVNQNIEVVGIYEGADTAILHRCKIDGHEWMARPGNILSGKGCPRCQESHGEREIEQWLLGHNIEYISQKTFSDCKNRRLLPFDFYLPKYDTCIEYDGEQHFRSVDFFGGDDGLKRRKRNDEIKNQYCKDNNIDLLRIPYFKNIEEELNNFLFI